jgi:hypothetical protein
MALLQRLSLAERRGLPNYGGTPIPGVHPLFSAIQTIGAPGVTTMTKKHLFRRVFDSMIEGRRKEAQRHIDAYLRQRGQEPSQKH